MDSEQARKQEMMARIVSGLAKPLGWRAGREPDATWHRPSLHRPGLHYSYEPPSEHVYNPDVECPEDYRPEPEKPKQAQRDGKCELPNGVYFVRGGNVYDAKGRLVRDPDIRRRCGLKK